jgi:hypothetical protein
MGAERHQAAGPIRGGIGKRYATSDRSVIANRAVGNFSSDLLHQPTECLWELAVFNRSMRRQSADSNVGRRYGNLFELLQSPDVDQKVGQRDSQIEHGH